MSITNLANDLVWCINKHDDKPHAIWRKLHSLVAEHADSSEDKEVALDWLEELMMGRAKW